MELSLGEVYAEQNRVSVSGQLKQIPELNHWGFWFSHSKTAKHCPPGALKSNETSYFCLAALKGGISQSLNAAIEEKSQ